MELSKGSIYTPRKGKKGPVKFVCICAHPDDCELMAIDGIQRGYRATKYTFACVVTTDGLDAERCGRYLKMTDKRMVNILANEEKKAANIGRYNSVYFMNYSSEEARDQDNQDIINEYVEIIKELKPRVIYTHSLLDRHPTHVAVAVKVINALRTMKKGDQPKVLYGCESERNLEWVAPEKIVTFNISKNMRLQRQLISVHKSQNLARDYVNAAIGRRYVNAVFNKVETKKNAKLTAKAINMTTLLRRKEYPIKRFAMSFIDDLYGELNDMMDRTL
ncbi:MAG: PIG-L family deacetylase [Bacilli bacterium]|nr:PIG-L family deacetylase [Bacilli bacterium]